MEIAPSSSHGSRRSPRPVLDTYSRELKERAPAVWDQLTFQERRVAELAAKPGLTEAEIGKHLGGIKPGTVGVHIARIADKIVGSHHSADRRNARDIVQNWYAVLCGASTEGLDLPKRGPACDHQEMAR